MSEERRVRHLLRRFGLGASPPELEMCLPLGVDGTLNRLLDYEKVPENFPISPWEFCFEPDSDMVYLDPIRPASWWGLRMLLTQRPLQEKLTLFWHNHFAVSAQKVEFGPMMLDYIEVLRTNASGHFPTLLKRVSRTPAMIRWLDTDENIKGSPNENFAREVLELFTLGIGHFTEKDVAEAARAFTGWGIRYLVFERGGEMLQEVARASIEKDRPMTAFAFSPDLHDDAPKTILGKTAAFSAEQVLDLMALQPQTAKRLVTKLWEFFAYPKPEPPVVERLARAFLESDGQIKPVLRAIATSDQFWSERCYRAVVKSPVDFTLPILRQFVLGQLLLSMRGIPKGPTTPLPKPLRDASGLVFGTLFQQGMTLLYPPDVGGWEWGDAWITSQNMAQRMKLPEVLFADANNDQPLTNWLRMRLGQQGMPKTEAELVDWLVRNFDADLPEPKRTLLIEACKASGGVGALSSGPESAKMFASITRLLFSAPEFQFM